jgi:hypothetical protein
MVTDQFQEVLTQSEFNNNDINIEQTQVITTSEQVTTAALLRWLVQFTQVQKMQNEPME